MGFEQIVSLGLAALFGGLLLWLPIGAVAARFFGFQVGVGVGALLFGLTGLAAAGTLAWYVFRTTTEVQAQRSGCTAIERAPAEAGSRSREQFTLALAGGGEKQLHVDHDHVACSQRADGQVATLRVRRADLQGSAPAAAAELVTDAKQAVALIGVFGAFGGFGFLTGCFMLAAVIEDRRKREPKPVSRERARMATAFTVAGNLTLVGCLVGAGLVDWDAERSTVFAFRGVTVACLCYVAALALRRSLTVSAVLFFIVLGGGFYLAAVSLQYLG
jgi:hypothetical protein